MPKALANSATRRPMRPKPITASVAPSRSPSGNASRSRQRPSATNAVSGPRRLTRCSMSARAPSATPRVPPLGVTTTGMPRRGGGFGLSRHAAAPAGGPRFDTPALDADPAASDDTQLRRRVDHGRIDHRAGAGDDGDRLGKPVADRLAGVRFDLDERAVRRETFAHPLVDAADREDHPCSTIVLTSVISWTAARGPSLPTPEPL